MLDHDRTTSEIDGDSSDVVEGPVGDADLVDPTIAKTAAPTSRSCRSSMGPRDRRRRRGSVEPADTSGS